MSLESKYKGSTFSLKLRKHQIYGRGVRFCRHVTRRLFSRREQLICYRLEKVFPGAELYLSVQPRRPGLVEEVGSENDPAKKKKFRHPHLTEINEYSLLGKK